MGPDTTGLVSFKKRHPQAGSILHTGTEKLCEHTEREQSADQEETPPPHFQNQTMLAP